MVVVPSSLLLVVSVVSRIPVVRLPSISLIPPCPTTLLVSSGVGVGVGYGESRLGELATDVLTGGEVGVVLLVVVVVVVVVVRVVVVVVVVVGVVVVGGLGP